MDTAQIYYQFARKLALALTDEVMYNGIENASEASLELLSIARNFLNLQKEFDDIDTLEKMPELDFPDISQFDILNDKP